VNLLRGFLGILGLVSGLSSAVASRRVGRIEQESFDEEAQAVQLQGQITLEESRVEAERVAEINRRFGEQQKVNFLKSGVTLAGSPLLVLEETARESAKEVAAIERRGLAQFGLASAKARILKKKGRARLIGRTAEGLATGVSALTGFGKAGGFTGELFKAKGKSSLVPTDTIFRSIGQGIGGATSSLFRST